MLKFAVELLLFGTAQLPPDVIEQRNEFGFVTLRELASMSLPLEE